MPRAARRMPALALALLFLGCGEGPPPPASPRPAAPAEQPLFTTAPDTMLRVGLALEARHPDRALAAYRDVVRDFPGTPEARSATARIAALGGK